MVATTDSNEMHEMVALVNPRIFVYESIGDRNRITDDGCVHYDISYTKHSKRKKSLRCS